MDVEVERAAEALHQRDAAGPGLTRPQPGAPGEDQVTAFSALATSINNMGPGLGLVIADFTQVNDFAKWVCLVAMLIGRLEVFTLLVLVSPVFWRS